MIRLCEPEIGQKELDRIKSVLDSKWLIQGERVQELEETVSGFLNVKYAVAVSSGTAALHLALLALGIGAGDEVIVPDFTFPATANVVEVTGAKTVLTDVSGDTYCLDTSGLEKLITGNTKAVIPVHEFGHTVDMNRVLNLATKYNLAVIEDAACALGAEYCGIKAGTIGDIGCFSLHPRRIITTGEGGVVVTSNPELAEKVRCLRSHGMADSGTGKVFAFAGLNYRMTDMQGALGVVQASRISDIIDKRIMLANKYNELLGNVRKIKIPICRDYCKHAYQTYHVILDDSVNRDYVIRSLNEKGIETNIGAYSVSAQPYYINKYGFKRDNFKNSLHAFTQGLALPLHTGLSFEDINFIVSGLLEIVGE